MRLSTKISGIIAVGGVAALGAGLISSGGIGAMFTDKATANATIDVGDFSCTLASSDPALTYLAAQTDGTYLANFNLGKILSSAAGSKSAALTVTNSGDIPIKVTWTATKVASNLGSKFTPIPVASTILASRGDTQNANIGFDWTELNNNDLTHSGTAQYKISCDEIGFSFWTQSGGTATWANSAVSLSVDGSSGSAAGISINNVEGEALPTDEPVLDDSQYAAGNARFVITFTDGSKVMSGALSSVAGELRRWDISKPATGEPTGWTTNQPWSAVQTADGSKTVKSVDVLIDEAASGSHEVTCVDYSGTPLFGSC